MALPFTPPASLDASFTMSRPTEADIDRLAKVYFDSFATDPSNTYWWSEDDDAMAEWLHARIRRKMADRGVRHFQILDAQRDVVAFVRWDIPKGYEVQFGEWVGIDDDSRDVDVDVDVAVTKEEEEEEDTEKQQQQSANKTVPVAKPVSIPRGADRELCETFFAKLAEFSKKWEAEKMLGLSLLCTAPKYHRRGAGKALLAPMLAIADSVGLRSYVEATRAGQPLYEKLGFRVVETRELDATAVTGGRVKGVSSLSIMIREPQPR
ncbi:hypothetical protein F4859DRAFT_85335 [Xylaria cf. heliscus]|nr:hypothetical protein F4859DRAFT_85335 [Xylaria cf. heliscus]